MGRAWEGVSAPNRVPVPCEERFTTEGTKATEKGENCRECVGRLGAVDARRTGCQCHAKGGSLAESAEDAKRTEGTASQRHSLAEAQIKYQTIVGRTSVRK